MSFRQGLPTVSGIKGRIRSHIWYATSGLLNSMRPLSRKAYIVFCFCLASSKPRRSPHEIQVWHSSSVMKLSIALMVTGCFRRAHCDSCSFLGSAPMASISAAAARSSGDGSAPPSPSSCRRAGGKMAGDETCRVLSGSGMRKAAVGSGAGFCCAAFPFCCLLPLLLASLGLSSSFSFFFPPMLIRTQPRGRSCDRGGRPTP
mmetsp:Transcript_62692/g.141511  ORF Transcript_62692/g.141511 Transcript_62692/m.141511 type:complete len:202 (-) Transcript_62692:8-613(-)